MCNEDLARTAMAFAITAVVAVLGVVTANHYVDLPHSAAMLIGIGSGLVGWTLVRLIEGG